MDYRKDEPLCPYRPRYSLGEDQSKQFAVLLAHPLRTIRVFFENITNFPFFDFQLGYSDNTKWTHVPVLISLFSVIGFISSFRIQDENQSIINREERIIYNLSSKIIFLGIMLLIFLIFLLQSTEVGSEAIVGIQGRYFFAFLPLLIPFSNGKNMLDETQSVKVLFLSTNTSSILFNVTFSSIKKLIVIMHKVA